MDLAAAITQKDKHISNGRIRKELKRELATARSYRILKKSREKKNLPKNYRSTYPPDNQPTTLQQHKQTSTKKRRSSHTRTEKDRRPR